MPNIWDGANCWLKVSCATGEHSNPKDTGQSHVLDLAAMEDASPPTKHSLREEKLFANMQSKEIHILQGFPSPSPHPVHLR